jgi:hypothetical protein
LPDAPVASFLPASSYLRNQNTIKVAAFLVLRMFLPLMNLQRCRLFEQASAQQTQIGQPFTAESGAASGAASSAQYGQHARAQLQYSLRQSGAA